MFAIEAILGGVILGGLYALVAIGFNLQFGMARIVNLAYGEFLMGAAFAAFWMFTLFGINPIVGMIFSVPVTFAAKRGLSALAFAGGGALVAAAGTLVSTFLAFNPSIGIDFTVKALVVVVMGGIGNMAGSLIAGILLGVAEALCSYYVDSGLTLAVAYALFLIVLVVRPRGLFGTP